MNLQELETEKKEWHSQITGATEASRYLNALTKVVYWATEAKGINFNDELQSVFDLIQYYQVSAQLYAYREGKKDSRTRSSIGERAANEISEQEKTVLEEL